jgi:hypothetical protein
MSQQSSIALNITQNQSDFRLSSLENLAPIFKYELFSKTLDPPKDNPELIDNYRTVTIKCLQQGCR